MIAGITGCNRRRSIFAQLGAAILLTTAAAAAAAQSTHPALERQVSRMDLGVSAVGEFTPSSSGTNYLAQTVQNSPSTTVGVLVTLRYTKSPLVGAEFNYHYARYTENFSYTALSPSGGIPTLLGVQTNATEYTFGYVAQIPRQIFGLQPFAGAGAGSIAFRPTRSGGQGYQPQARAAYYYEVGAQQILFNSHFGVRAQFRQVFHLSPDYETNYLTIHHHAISTEPTIGFYLHF